MSKTGQWHLRCLMGLPRQDRAVNPAAKYLLRFPIVLLSSALVDIHQSHNSIPRHQPTALILKPFLPFPYHPAGRHHVRLFYLVQLPASYSHRHVREHYFAAILIALLAWSRYLLLFGRRFAECTLMSVVLSFYDKKDAMANLMLVVTNVSGY